MTGKAVKKETENLIKRLKHIQKNIETEKKQWQ